MKLSILALSAVSAQDSSILWPAQAPWSNRMWCGSQTPLVFAANSTCTVTLNKGQAAWLNAGGAFVTSAGTQDTFYFHTYSAEATIPFTVFYQMSENNTAIDSIPFNEWGQPAYPEEWQAECFLRRDQKLQEPAVISCEDNYGPKEGVFMMGFTYSNNGAGAQNVQIQNTDGHIANSKYTLTLNSAAYFNGTPEVAIAAATSVANATVNVIQPNIIEVELTADYLGELLPVSFEYASELNNYEPYQAAWSTVTVE